jgi:hypothetical protein
MYVSGSALVARLRAVASVAHIRLIPGKPPNAVVTAKPTTWKGRPFSVIVWPRRRFAASAKDRSTTTPSGRIHVPSVILGWSTAPLVDRVAVCILAWLGIAGLDTRLAVKRR